MNAPENPPELVEGTLDQILYINEESGYVVAVVELGDHADARRRITVVGELGTIEIGAGLRLSGRFEKHPRYGEQFRVVDFETLRPAGVNALERYLASEIKGVGPVLARRIVDRFGEELPALLDTSPERLHEVDGLPRAVAQRIAIAWRDSSGLRELTVFLRGHGIAAAHARRIHKVYGRDSLETVRNDPYLLARTITGIGFRTADAVAEKLGIPRNSIQRARAAMIFMLERMADEGHVFAPFGYLEHQFQSALEMDPELARAALDELVASGEIVAEDVDGAPTVYLKRLHEAEAVVADRIRLLVAGRPMGAAVIEKAMEAARKPDGIALSTEQLRALKTALQGQSNGDYGRSGHRQDDAIEVTASGARFGGSEADAGGTDRARRATARGGQRSRSQDDPSPARVLAGDQRVLCARNVFRCGPTS